MLQPFRSDPTFRTLPSVLSDISHNFPDYRKGPSFFFCDSALHSSRFPKKQTSRTLTHRERGHEGPAHVARGWVLAGPAWCAGRPPGGRLLLLDTQSLPGRPPTD